MYFVSRIWRYSNSLCSIVEKLRGLGYNEDLDLLEPSYGALAYHPDVKPARDLTDQG